MAKKEIEFTEYQLESIEYWINQALQLAEKIGAKGDIKHYNRILDKVRKS